MFLPWVAWAHFGLQRPGSERSDRSSPTWSGQLWLADWDQYWEPITNVIGSITGGGANTSTYNIGSPSQCFMCCALMWWQIIRKNLILSQICLGERGKYCLEFTQIFTNKLEENSIWEFKIWEKLTEQSYRLSVPHRLPMMPTVLETYSRKGYRL